MAVFLVAMGVIAGFYAALAWVCERVEAWLDDRDEAWEDWR